MQRKNLQLLLVGKRFCKVITLIFELLEYTNENIHQAVLKMITETRMCCSICFKSKENFAAITLI